jgi:hypothetical protein
MTFIVAFFDSLAWPHAGGGSIHVEGLTLVSYPSKKYILGGKELILWSPEKRL